MGKLWNAIGNVFRERRDKAAEALGNPVRDGKFAIEDSEKQIASFRTEVARLRAETIKMEKQHKNALAEKKKFDGFAKQAAADGKADDVATCAAKVQEWGRKATELKGQISKNEQVTAGLRKQLDAADSKVQRAKSNHQALAARKKGADIRNKLAQSSQAFTEGQGGLAALDALEDAVEDSEAQAEAFEEMSTSGEPDMEAKYGAGGSADAEGLAARYMADAKAAAK